MPELKDRLDEIDRDVIIRDVVDVIDNEVKSKGGLTGVALKGGYNAVKKLRNGHMIEDAVDELLDDFSRALSPMYEEYLDDESFGSFEEYVAANEQEATDALLSITDDRADDADNEFLAKTYGKLRGQAVKHVTAALPRVGRLIDKHAPRD